MKKISLILYCAIIAIVLYGCSKANVATEVSSFKESDMKVQLETEHFIFYSTDGDKKCLDDLSGEAESNYKRITSNLKTTLNYKPKVYIYPDLHAFHESIGQPNAPDWAVGTAWGKDLKMVSPLNPGSVHNYDAIKQVLIHEFVHVVQINMVNNPQALPTWMWEGVATYEANQINDEVRKQIKKEVTDAKAPTLEQLTKDFYTVNGAYKYSYTIADFLVNQYGYDKLVGILKEHKDMERILGISMDEFEKQWVQYIKEKY